ncbi:MAG: hypothetical protein JXA64_10690 [Candidatus Fermentibacteraceae bacterium]|nr:hypothetical protein [Candidatus Fermentibacteraceae bacterium]MBN2609570.1 hypothetical protein [Candidatus Fermentibacteraceae bacterium]
MGQRLTDYALVAFVILVVFGLFRLSRLVMNSMLKHIQVRYGTLSPDMALYTAFLFLLAGLMFLPAFTSLLAVINNQYLFGGMVLHLVLVAVSIILFSIAEDMFREFPSMPGTKDLWTISSHFRRMSVPFAVFWALGVVFISPLFYSGLTVILALFYLFALSCRKVAETAPSGKKD